MCSGCSMAPFAKTAGSSVPASLRPDARPSSARAANNRACSGQNKEQRMSWLCVASTAANDSTRSGNTASINTPDAMTPFLFQLNEESCPAPLGGQAANLEISPKHIFSCGDGVARQDLGSQVVEELLWILRCVARARQKGRLVAPRERHEQIARDLFHGNQAVRRQFHFCARLRNPAVGCWTAENGGFGGLSELTRFGCPPPRSGLPKRRSPSSSGVECRDA